MSENRQEFEARIIATADYFHVCVHHGRRDREYGDAPTLDEARMVARRLACDRPAMIYALKAEGATHRSVHVENVS